MTTLSVPLFPLQTVLFPGGPLSLRVFEARYLDMVSHCMKKNEPFGVVLITEGNEAGSEVITQATGTLAMITDWYQGADGLLGITATGESRFRLMSMYRQDDGLNTGDIEILPPEPEAPVPGDYLHMAKILHALLDDIGGLYEQIPRDFDDASWVGYRLAETLPIEQEQKQYCLELDDPLARLEFLNPFLQQVA
ncbi:MAG: peptidase S16 [Gammaproteobacteria bacterium]|nr:peptidase S16 [Gammaproteobacteria bacterium]MCP4088561.1 peptidase S16 [Gammaproteobacteria bacterium]MCP4276531.1 peptidase S16 [Gammaproteobacteria bacterium]MCP4832408.1 peptidase S16 [Gammaproteobacteria bacterium]MCP4929078.1 peptidase S16 [Gammaproteobacteria bacterium]